MRVFFLAQVVLLSIAVSACASAQRQACAPAHAKPRAALTCAVPGFDHRPYDIHLPADYSAARPVPVVLAIHGGGGNSKAAARTSCPGGDIDSPDCLHAMAAREGVAVVYPNGTSARLVTRVRTWNAGGIAAIAALGGANQHATTAACAPPRPVPVLQVHGTADPCWRYEGGKAACAQRDDTVKISVNESMRIWAAINGCASAQAAQPMASEPRIKTDRIAWKDCRAETTLIRMEGGGHVWPGGWAYFRESIIGPMVGGWSADRVILDFFRRNPMPE